MKWLKPFCSFCDVLPSVLFMLLLILKQQRNDEEVSEFEKQKRIEENYRFQWSKTKKEKKEKKTGVFDD